MATKKLKPTTPGSRHRTAPKFDDVTVSKPKVKRLLKGKDQSGGRNRQGRMTSRHRGGGHKRRYRTIDFKRNKYDIPAKVQTIEYDPNRSARIALVAYADGEKRYIIAPDKLTVGDTIISSNSAIEPDPGNAMPMRNMPPGTFIHNIEMNPGKGAQLCRSAGTVAQMVAKTDKYVTVKLPSGEVRMILGSCFATVGTTSNPDHFNTTIGKAGRNRWKGKRPQTRGVAMNPIDHPMGGGEGKASGGHPRSPWGQSSKGLKTRKRKKLSDRYIVRSRKKSKK
ncbi:50S ribosomal protein L2 [Fodinibius sediminis]|uniref:Large ribosomal subunit protein uL2 n=1 Tax=Fodinibius sediminis TaxID=1214077 RepID=A0A521FC97_9BACT|nr:50S ribosomal protein L2 [Fodinibius sediminis]SMO93775.1 large subunit ribosomal protein L2 [Fodinibius sediminis]